MAITLNGTAGITTPSIVADTDTLYVDATNNRVGVGTSSPTGKLQVTGAGGVSGSSNLVYVDVSSSFGGISVNSSANNNSFVELLEAGTKVGGFNADTTNNVTSIQSAGGHALGFNYNNTTEAMRITTGGSLFVGTTTGTIDQSNFGFVVASGELNLSRNVGGSSPTMTAYGSQGYARIMGDGDLENTNNRYTGISDIKFKQNIVDAKSQWSDIKAIQVRNYELIDYPDRKQIGVVAQELEQVCPHLVIDREDKDGETYKSVAYSVLYMKAVKALQEAMERIENLEARIETLENK